LDWIGLDWIGFAMWDEADVGDDGRGEVARKMASYTAPRHILDNMHNPAEQRHGDGGDGGDDDGDELDDYFGKSRRIVDRESDYQRRRLNRTLSPPRIDPFADPKASAAAPSSSQSMRTYGDAFKDAALEREKFYTIRNIQEKQKKLEQGGEGEQTGQSEKLGNPNPYPNARDPARHRGGGDVRNSGRRDRSRSPYRSDEWEGAGDDAGGRGSRRHNNRGEEIVGNVDGADADAGAGKVSQVDFGLSGKLAEETNTVNGVTLVYSEPPEASKPRHHWRLYVFKNGKPLDDVLHIHRQSFYLFGRERRVVDVPTDHPSCSKQHAVIQFRSVAAKEGLAHNGGGSDVRPYLMDLGSTNGTFINGSRLDPQRYYQLLEKDTIKMGCSSREYVMLHDKSV